MENNKSKQYSAEEKRAYYMGLGAGIGHFRGVGTLMKSMPKSVKESFGNGFDKGILTKKKNLSWKNLRK